MKRSKLIQPPASLDDLAHALGEARAVCGFVWREVRQVESDPHAPESFRAHRPNPVRYLLPQHPAPTDDATRDAVRMTNAPLPLAGRCILITGAARRLGAVTARHLHAAGAAMAVHHHTSVAEATELVARFNAVRAGSAVAVAADIADVVQSAPPGRDNSRAISAGSMC